jgi:hypothetical protein
MNNIAISPSIAMYALQNQNVERKIAKQIDLKSPASLPLAEAEAEAEIVGETLAVAEDTNTTNIADIPLADPEMLVPTSHVGSEF